MTCIMVFEQANHLEAYSKEGKMEVLTTLAAGTYIFCFPYYTWKFLFVNMKDLRSTVMREKYDSLYQNIEVLKGPIAFSFSLVFCYRRLIFAYVIAMVSQTIVFQVFIIDFLSMLLLSYYICIRPMTDVLNNFIHIFNEFIVLFAIQMLFLFTLYVEDPTIRY